MKQGFFHILILLLICAVTFGFKAGDREFWGRHGEARRAEVSREMLVSGDWVIPRLNGEPFVTKTPLYYWAAALMFSITEKFDELSPRIPSMISGTIGVLITYFWASVLFSRRVGLFAGIILATNFLYGGMARTAGVDMMLTMFTTAALCCFTVGLECGSQFASSGSPQRKLCTSMYLLTAAWVGLGTMSKNPIGIAVPLLAIVGYILVTREWKLIIETKPWWSLVIILVIVLPWFFLVYQRVPNLLEVIHQETVGRYTDPESTSHLEPFYYYIPALGAFAPWVTFLPGVILTLMTKKIYQFSKTYLFLIVASITTFLLFSSVGSKREYYLLPLYPMLAILVAKFWDEYAVMKKTTARRWTWKLMDIPIVAFVGALCLPGVVLPIGAKRYLPNELALSVGFGILFLVAGIGLIIIFLRGNVLWTFGMYSVATIWVYLFALMVIVPEMDRYRSRKEFLHEVAEIARNHTIIDYNYEGFDLQYYLQRIVPVFTEPDALPTILTGNNPVFIITTDGHYAKLQKEHPAIAEKFEVVLRRVWTSALNPKRQKSLLLLKTKLP